MAHNLLRVDVVLELPIVDTGTTDPSLTETASPWLLDSFLDGRREANVLAGHVFGQLKLSRVAVLRSQTSYARIGAKEFSAAARRAGRPPLAELEFESDETDYSPQLQKLANLGVDGVVIWSEPSEAGLVLKQMRALGITQPVFGSDRLADWRLVQIAGPAAEGFVAVGAMDPTRTDPKWQRFDHNYRKRFDEAPAPHAAYAYDGMTLLIGVIEKVRLNRGRIMAALREYQIRGI